MQDKHLEELGRLGTESTLQRLKLANDLDQYYGDHERKLRGDVERLESILKSSGPVRRLLLRWTKRIPDNPEQEIQNMRMTLANIAQRQTEAREALESRIQTQKHAIELRHREEKLTLHSASPETFAVDQRSDPYPYKSDLDEDLGPSLSY